MPLSFLKPINCWLISLLLLAITSLSGHSFYIWLSLPDGDHFSGSPLLSVVVSPRDSPKIVAEQGLKSWSFVFRIRVEVGELTLVE